MRGQGLRTIANAAYDELSFGLIGAIVLIYLVIVVTFQSWIDPFVIITAVRRWRASSGCCSASFTTL